VDCSCTGDLVWNATLIKIITPVQKVLVQPRGTEIENVKRTDNAARERIKRNDNGKKWVFVLRLREVFATRANSESRIRIHAGEKAYSCDVCWKSFVRVSDLTNHYRTQRRKTLFVWRVNEASRDESPFGMSYKDTQRWKTLFVWRVHKASCDKNQFGMSYEDTQRWKTLFVWRVHEASCDKNQFGMSYKDTQRWKTLFVWRVHETSCDKNHFGVSYKDTQRWKTIFVWRLLEVVCAI